MSELINDIQQAKQLLIHGEVVGIPTETVYGLAADAASFNAIHQIYRLKNRPMDKTLALNVHAQWPISQWCEPIPQYVQQLIKTFWPGPLTLVLKRNPNANLLPMIIGPDDSIALRCPNHPLTINLLALLKQPLVAPSANPSHELSPTNAEQVADFFPNDDIKILDGGACELGMESTILKIIDDKHCEILRYGAISAQDIFTCIGFMPQEKKIQDNKSAIKSHFYYFETLAQLQHCIKTHPDLDFGLIAEQKLLDHYPNALLSLALADDPRQKQKQFYDLMIQASLYQNLSIFIQCPSTANPEYLHLIQQIKKFAKPIHEL